ncbi:hypothetical protein P7228_10475, partial [Altererythrobacter arenosus]
MAEFQYVDGDGEVYYDLTETGNDATIDSAIFRTLSAEGSSGTGLIQAFVRVQATGTEQGYNTDGRGVPYDENSSPQFTTSLLLSDVPIVEIDGTSYYEFRLDINEANSTPLLSLNELKLYTTTNPNLTAELGSAAFDAATTPIWDLDDQNLDGTDDTDNTLLLDYSLQAGSGKSDMFFYIPVDDFGGADPETTNVLLYSEFGTTGTLDDTDGGDFAGGGSGVGLWGDYTSESGFEEWSVSKVADGVLTGFKWDDLDGDGMWDVAMGEDSGEEGIGDFWLKYSYTTGNGNNAILHEGVVNTNSIGQYFIPLVDGNNQDYTVTITELGFALEIPVNDNPLDPANYTLEGWAFTFDGDGTLDGVTQVIIDKDLEGLPEGEFQVTEQLNFGNVEYGSISGTKFVDGDGDLETTDDQSAYTEAGGWTI